MRTEKEFKHINDVWKYLEAANTIKELQKRFDDIPSRFGQFDIVNEKTWKTDDVVEIVNTYYDKNIGEMQEAFWCVKGIIEEGEKMINKAYDKLYSSYKTDMANVLKENKITDKTVDEAIHEDLLDKRFSPVEALCIVDNFTKDYSFYTLTEKDIKLKFINYALRLDNPFETVEEAKEVCEEVGVELSDDILQELLTNKKYEVDY